MTVTRFAFALLLLGACAIALSAQSAPLLDPQPGVYGRAVELGPIGDVPLSYRFVDANGEPHSDFFLPFEDSILLDAPAGSDVRYHIELEGTDQAVIVEYQIDTRPPSVPRLDPRPGLYTQAVQIVGQSDDDSVVFALDANGRFRPVSNENPLAISGTAGEVSDIDVLVYAEDAVGNRSEARLYQYRIDRRAEQNAPFTMVQSPVPGSFVNEQLLLIDTTGLSDVRYALGTESEQLSYSRPVLLSGSGELRVVVTAREILTGRVRSEEVRWRQNRIDNGSTSSGAYIDSVVLAPSAEPQRFTLQDRPVRSIDPFQNDALVWDITPDVRRVVVLRRAGADGDEERYVYVLEGRRPPPPRLFFDEDRVRLTALSDTEIAYTVDDPDIANATPYSDPFALPEGGEVYAWSRFPDGAWSAPLRTVVEPAPLPQAITAEAILWDGTTLLLDLAIGTRFELSGLSTGEIVATDRIRYRPPRGYHAPVALIVDGVVVANIDVDAAPPAPPSIVVNGRRVSVSGDGDLFIRVDGGTFSAFTETVTLGGEPGVRIDYRVDAYRIADGEQSAVARRIVTVDRRPLRLPPFVEPVADQLFRTGQLELRFAHSYEDLVIYYELSSDGPAQTPTERSAVTRDVITVETADREVVTWNLSIRGRFEQRDGWTPVERYSFSVDRLPPSPPVIVRPNAPVQDGSRLIVEFADPDPDARLFYRVRDDELFLPYDGPISINAPEFGDREYRIDAYTVDPAGNQTTLAEPLAATLTSLRPGPPVYSVNGRRITGASVALAREALLSIESTGGRLYWRVLEGSEPQFAPYDEPLRLVMPGEGVERTVRVEAYRESSDGLRSPVSRLTVILDRSAPVRPAAPFVYRESDGRRGFVIWPGNDDDQIFVAIEGSESEELFVPTEGRVDWVIPDDRASITIRYFAIDGAGNRSEPGLLEIRPPDRAAVPIVAGVEAGGLYQSERTVELLSDLPIRYTISLDGSRPPIVHPLSARYEQALRFTASLGEELAVRIRYRSQNATGDLSPEGEIAFTIDRRPPAAPQIRGVEANTFYADAQVATLEASDPDDSVYYRIVTGQRNPNEFELYRGQQLRLEAMAGRRADYTIEAYTIDGAGNRSADNELWRVTIDREIVYVSANAVDGDGTRRRPVATLDAALRQAIAEGRRTVFLSAGEYEIDTDLLVNATAQIEGLALVGGFDVATWERGSRDTLIRGMTGEIELSGGVELRSLRLLGNVSIARGVETPLFQDVRLFGRTSTVTLSAGARLRVEDSVFEGALIVGTDADVEALRSELSGVYVDGGRLALDGGTVAHVAAIDANVYARGTRFVIPRREVVRPSGLERPPRINASAAAVLRDTQLFLEDASLTSAENERNVTLVHASGGATTIRRGLLDARASGAALAVRQTGGTLRLEDSRVVVAGGRYGYGVVQRGGRSAYVNSILVIDGGEELIAVVATDATVAAAHSLFELQPGPESVVLQGVNHTGPTTTYIVNSAFLTHPGGVNVGESTGINLGTDANASVSGSFFSGWRHDLVRVGGPTQWASQNTVLVAEQFVDQGFGIDNYSGPVFTSGLSTELLQNGTIADLATAYLSADPAPAANAGIPLSRLPETILGQFADSSLLVTDIREVERDPVRPDVGPIEF